MIELKRQITTWKGTKKVILNSMSSGTKLLPSPSPSLTPPPPSLHAFFHHFALSNRAPQNGPYPLLHLTQLTRSARWMALCLATWTPCAQGPSYGSTSWLTPGAPGKVGRGIPGSPSLLWMAVADTIWADDMAAMCCRALSFAVWSLKVTVTHRINTQHMATGQLKQAQPRAQGLKYGATKKAKKANMHR